MLHIPILILPLVILNVHTKRKIKAAGLIEMLIAMAIFAIAVISITSLNAKNYMQIKTNELNDFANIFMVSSMEFMKTPTSTTASGTAVQKLIEDALIARGGGEDEVCFRMTGDMGAAIPTFGIVHVNNSLLCPNNIAGTAPAEVTIRNNTLNLSNCNTSNTYRVSISGANITGLLACNIIIVKKVQTTQQQGYFIISRIVYRTPLKDPTTNSQFRVNEIFGFRPFTYEQ